MIELAFVLALEGSSFVMPPLAAEKAPISQVLLSPVYSSDFTCTEHFAGQLPYAGDALGTDCMVTGGVDGASGYSRMYRTDGRRNEDWYGWNAEVLSPVDGTVVGVLVNERVNRPGVLGKPPAGLVQIRREDGVVVVLAHLSQIAVRPGETVRVGQTLARVGNNGTSRSPHVHVGAWREQTNEPLQIRWDQAAMARLR